MKRQRNFRSVAHLLVLAGAGMTIAGAAALADSVPESIRIQEQAEKAYEAHPVVPIDRGNAHHRDLKDEEQGAGDYAPQNLPARTKTDRPSSNK